MTSHLDKAEDVNFIIKTASMLINLYFFLNNFNYRVLINYFPGISFSANYTF